MWFVYIIKSKRCKFKYVGCTSEVYKRVEEHNEGLCRSTKAYRPFELVAYVAVRGKFKALDLEKYLKTGSGTTFIKKHIL
ncbi:MAG: GIY-YIG nuclease family protein [Candidatus Omnitrophica bacterium]|nr:GIY-YIG nuclease family protein [Candidatus Omnitrophota bacterium]